MALEPGRESLEAWKEDALGDVGLIQLVADLPLEIGGNDDFEPEIRVRGEPFVQCNAGIRDYGKEGELIDDAVVDGRRLEEEGKGLGGERVQLGKGLDLLGQHLHREHVGPLPTEAKAQALGYELVGLQIIDTPDHAVPIELGKVRGRKMERGIGRVGPVEEPRRQPVVLRDGEPMPHGVALDHPAMGVFAEVAQQMLLELRAVLAHAQQGGAQRIGNVRKAAIGTAGAIPPQLLDPGVPE